MAATEPTIIATSIPGFNRSRDQWAPGPIFQYAIEQARPRRTPRLCVLTTAGGDQRCTVERVRKAFAEHTEVELSVLTLFDRPSVEAPDAHLRAQDVVWVDRGSLANLLAVWWAHDIANVLRQCWEDGVVLSGESAGSLCWFQAGTTDSCGPVRPCDALGFLPYANAVHYTEDHRRPLFQRLIADGTFPDGFATDAGAGLHFQGTELVAAISDRANAAAYHIISDRDGGVTETPLEMLRLKTR